MSSFEFVFGLVSVITSLALTQLLGGMVALYRCGERLRLSWRHGLWVATAFMLLVGNWAALWGMREGRIAGVLDVLVPLLYTSVLYAFCDMVMPDKPADGAIVDLREYHARDGRRYKMLQLLFAVMVAAAIARSSTSLADWAGKANFAMLAVVIGTVALRTHRTWLDTATAAILAVMAALFMTVRLQVLAA